MTDCKNCTALRAENERLQAAVDHANERANNLGGRYWEGRYRDEAAENERLRGGWEKVADQYDDLLQEASNLRAENERLRAALKLRHDAEKECLDAVEHVGRYNSGDRIAEAKGNVRAAFAVFEEAERTALEERT